ncbi:MAG TPA: hypothetical protein VIJ93_13805, partial [bacterium]
PDACGTGTLQIFTYAAPASIRVVLFDRMLYIGPYLYKKLKIKNTRRQSGLVEEKEELDSRGGELPLFAIPYDNPDFLTLSKSIHKLVANWKEKGVATEGPLITR